MSTDILDLKDSSLVSSCCGASVYRDLGICADCKEHCDAVPAEEDEDPLKEVERNNVRATQDY